MKMGRSLAAPLRRDSSGLLLGGGRGEDEGICLIDAADAKKVLAVCTLEHHCWLNGHIGNCGDVGECGKISGITSVHRH